MTASPRVLVVVNPAAGGGRAGRIDAELAATSTAFSAAARFRPSGSRELREGLGDAITAARPDRLLVLGGDGTVHDVVNALLVSGRTDVPLGLLPAGTGSDLVRTLGLPSDPADALRRALDGEPSALDVLRLDRESAPSPARAPDSSTPAGRRLWSVNVASVGISGAVDEAVNSQPDRGPTAYLRATVPALLRYRPRDCRIEADGECVHDGPVLLAALANGRTFGRGMPVAPRARPDDGLLDLVVVPPLRLWRLPILLPRFLRGRHLDHPAVDYRRARRVRIEPDPTGPPFDVDGETWPPGPITVTVEPGALRVVR